MIADRKDYYVNLSFICDGANKKDQFKVWEIKNTQLLGDIIDQAEWKQKRKKREFFKYMIKGFSKFMKQIENVNLLNIIQC